MAKQIPILLKNAFAKSGASPCYLVKVVTKENGVFGFCTADLLIRFDDGLGEVAYSPAEELRPQNIQSSADMTVDNTDLLGWFTDSVEEKVLSGAFASAELTIYRVMYTRLEYGAEVVAYGAVGEVDFNSDAKDKRRVEFRSLTQQLTQNANFYYSLTCRAAFGDEDCGMPFVWHNGTVALVPGANPFLIFKVTGVAQPADFFELGVINFVDGQNAGADLEVESWAADGTVKLSYPSPYPLTNGTAVKLRQDCGKTETDCINYGNIDNMQAEHLAPVEDASLMVPGTYIKSQNAL